MKNKTAIIALVVLAVLVFGGAYVVINVLNGGDRDAAGVSQDAALNTLSRLYKKIRVNTLPPVKERIDLSVADLKESLPDISKYPAQVEGTTADTVEIFASVEKTGAGKDGWLVEMAEQFNNARVMVDGKPVSVSIRGIASGAGMDYITSEKHVPDAYTPSNELWGDSLAAQGIKVALVEKRLAGNAAGIVLTKKKYAEIADKYGAVNIQTVTEAVAAGEVAMGYTNPFASATGANFLMSLLYSFDESNPLGDTAVAQFEGFQLNVPFVAYTTLQMKDSAKSGVLEGFVFEAQQFENSPDLKSAYVFTPFGVRHDNPLYAIGNLSPTKQEILRLFADFCKRPENQKVATDCGFNLYDDYACDVAGLNGELMTSAQRLWKEKKNSSRDIIAVFVADVSGSMDGEPLNKLKQSLMNGSKYIGKDCSIGLVTFSSQVNIALPIGKFDINQQSLFAGAVNSMVANGGTAMYDAIVVAEQMLMEQKANNPNAKFMLFVLSDGESNEGYELRDTQKMIEGLGIPVYTIGYNADIEVLATLSGINEAASINADTDDVVYKMGNLFNAEM